jgi:thiaminase/transcriptional activator TenA
MKHLFFGLLAFSFFSSQTQVLGHQEDFFAVTFNSCKKVLNQIKEMPFVQELAKGELCEERFAYYMVQDMPYLQELARQRGTLATQLQENKLTEGADVLATSAKRLAAFSKKIAKDVFQEYCKGTFKEQKGTIPCLARYLQHQTDSLKKGLACGVAALNPCPVVYHWVAKELQHLSPPENKYQMWVDNYSSTGYSDKVDFWKKIYNTLADKASIAERLLMKRSFKKSVEYEHAFFHESYYKLDEIGSSKRISVGSKKTEEK